MSASHCTHFGHEPTPCSRCGGFICAACRADAAVALCADCLVRRLDPLVRSGGFSVRGSLEGGVRLFRRRWGTLLALHLLGAPVVAVAQRVVQELKLFGVLGTLLVGLTVGLVPGMVALWVMHRAAHGESPGLVSSFFTVLPRLPQLAMNTFAVRLRIGLGLALLVMPGMYFWALYFVVNPATVLEQAKLPRIRELTEGVWKQLVLVGLAGLAVTLLPTLILTALTLQYWRQETGTVGLLWSCGSVFLFQLGGSCRDALALAAYYGLSKPAQVEANPSVPLREVA